jgi:hypothetical protein
VTDEVVDVDSRIASQRRSIDRIRVLLDQAVNIDDIVRIESELADREAEMDSLLQRQEGAVRAHLTRDRHGHVRRRGRRRRRRTRRRLSNHPLIGPPAGSWRSMASSLTPRLRSEP